MYAKESQRFAENIRIWEKIYIIIKFLVSHKAASSNNLGRRGGLWDQIFISVTPSDTNINENNSKDPLWSCARCSPEYLWSESTLNALIETLRECISYHQAHNIKCAALAAYRAKICYTAMPAQCSEAFRDSLHRLFFSCLFLILHGNISTLYWFLLFLLLVNIRWNL